MVQLIQKNCGVSKLSPPPPKKKSLHMKIVHPPPLPLENNKFLKCTLKLARHGHPKPGGVWGHAPPVVG